MANIIEKSYDLGVKSINLSNNENLLKAFKIAVNNGVDMKVVSTLGKTDMDYVRPDFNQAREEANIKEDIEKLAEFDNSVMLIDEFLVDSYDWDYLTNILEEINDKGINAGLITSFPFKTTEKLLKSSLVEDKNLFDFYMVPVNKVAYMMDCDDFLINNQQKLENLLKKLDKKIIINKTIRSPHAADPGNPDISATGCYSKTRRYRDENHPQNHRKALPIWPYKALRPILREKEYWLDATLQTILQTI